MATSSHTADFTGLPSGCTSVRISRSGVDDNSSGNRRDASTLDLADGSERLYVSAPLLDAGTGAVDGEQVTVTVSYLGSATQTIGSTTTVMGMTLKCTASEIEFAVGELMQCSATYVKIPTPE